MVHQMDNSKLTVIAAGYKEKFEFKQNSMLPVSYS